MSSSSDQQESTPSFFKVIRYPSAGYLSLPNAFVRRYFNKIPKNPTLVTATGEHSWRMKLVKMGEDYCFAHGWDELVKDAGLCSRDVVVFWLMDSRIFRVSFLGANGCEKYVPVVNKTSDEYDDVVVKDDGKCHNDDANLCFERVFGSFRYYMVLPIKFVKAAGLEHKESVKLKDHEGKEWTMRLTAHGKKGSASVVYSLSAGWAMFRKHYKLSEGDVGTFTFDKQQGVINLTQLIKSKRPIKQETPMGTQSCYGDANVQTEDQWSPTEKPCSSGGAGVKVNKTSDEYDDVVKDDGKCHNDDDANLCFERVIGQRSFGYYMLLPTKFVKASGLEHKESVKLKDHEGKEWTMRLITARGKKRSARVRYCLSAGWAMFRKHYKLSEGDVGIFTFDKQQGIINLTQLIKSKRPIKQETPMGTQSCYGDANVQIEDQWSPTEKPCSSGGAGVKVNKTSDEYDDVVRDDGKCHNDDDANLCFERVFGQRSFRLLLPIKFVKAAGLEHKESVKLKDHEGKEWTMRLTAEPGKKGLASVKYSISAGWAMFRKHCKLSEGDVGTFTFDKQEGVINLTQLIKSKRPIKQETPMGTQSCYGDANVQIDDQWSPTEKPCSSGGAGVKVKTEYESGPEMVVVKENRGRPPLKRCAEAKIEFEWVPEMMRKPKREMAPLEKPSKGGGVEVNAGMESVFRSKHVYF